MRQFLDRMDKPRVDEIRGIPPAIAIEQANPVKSSRSTVGTMTEINDYLKLLWPRIARAFCPSCGREIRPETAKSIADQSCTSLSELQARQERVAASRFGSRCPPKTEPQDSSFEFLQQQGYLRVWIDGEIVRVDADPRRSNDSARASRSFRTASRSATKIARAWSKRSRPRCVLAKAKINVVPISKPTRTGRCSTSSNESIRIRTSFLHRLALRALRHRYSSADARAFQFQQSARRVSRMPRLRPDDRDRSEQGDSGSQPEHRPRRGARFSGPGVWRIAKGSAAGLRPRRDRCRCSVRGIAESRSGFRDQRRETDADARSRKIDEDDDRWYGVRGFFRWLESKTYKMHVRVLLSRYRAYTTCPSCHGGRFQPEALNYQIVVPAIRRCEDQRTLLRTLPEFAALSISDARDVLAAIDISPSDSTAEMLRDEICRAPELSLRSRRRLSHARSFHAHAQRRRSAAREPDDLSRRFAGEHAFRHGRAERRAASARCRPARSRDARSARQGKHPARGRARGSDHSRGG